MDSGEEGADSGKTHDHDSTSSDSNSLDTSGTDASCISWAVKTNMFTTTSLGLLETDIKAKIPVGGVDDHTIKLPYKDETTVCTYVAACCLKGYV